MKTSSLRLAVGTWFMKPAFFFLGLSKALMGASKLEIAVFDADKYPELNTPPRYRLDDGPWINVMPKEC